MSTDPLEWHEFRSFMQARDFGWEKPCVYAIISSDGRFLYVGSSGNGFGERYWGQEGILQAFEDGNPKTVRIALVPREALTQLDFKRSVLLNLVIAEEVSKVVLVVLSHFADSRAECQYEESPNFPLLNSGSTPLLAPNLNCSGTNQSRRNL
jgi:hypothetical protein